MRTPGGRFVVSSSALPRKDPAAVARGKAGMAARWGALRHVKLAELDPNVAAAIRALVAADEAARARESEGSS